MRVGEEETHTGRGVVVDRRAQGRKARLIDEHHVGQVEDDSVEAFGLHGRLEARFVRAEYVFFARNHFDGR